MLNFVVYKAQRENCDEYRVVNNDALFLLKQVLLNCDNVFILDIVQDDNCSSLHFFCLASLD